MGRGDPEPHRQHAIQRAPADDLHVQLRRQPDDEHPGLASSRIGYRMRSRLHEMCEFLDLDGADYASCPANGGEEDLVALWKRKKRPTHLPRGREVKPPRGPTETPATGKADL